MHYDYVFANFGPFQSEINEKPEPVLGDVQPSWACSKGLWFWNKSQSHKLDVHAVFCHRYIL